MAVPPTFILEDPHARRVHVVQQAARRAEGDRATAGSYLGLLAVLTVLQTVNADLNLISSLPDWLETLSIPLLPGLITYVSGYAAKHTARPDLPLDQRWH
ncbi:hypothetical protein [Nonomuraea sp. NPDC049480]|uniref:hypothetical protein n=1 Tax=Nonomuraea sp. NPDC049480 TaxID=3364353 RepID=UPI00379F0F05